MARAQQYLQPIYMKHSEVPNDIDPRDVQLILSDAVNDHVPTHVTCVQRFDGVWWIWLNSREAREFLLNEVKSIIVNKRRITLLDEYPTSVKRFSSEKITFKDLPFYVHDDDILDYVSSQGIRLNTRTVIHARIRNKNGELTPYFSGDRFLYVRGNMQRVLPDVTDIAHHKCRIFHNTQKLACKRCKHTGHSTTDTELCEAYNNTQNITTIRSPNNPMSNFYPCTLNIYGEQFRSSEHVYQWKFARHIGREDLADDILHAPTAGKAKEIVSGIPHHFHRNWHAVKQEVMQEILREKSVCCPAFKSSLIRSTGSRLVEAVQSDRYWSSGLNPPDAATTRPIYYPGENHLGRILEIIRNDIDTEPEAAVLQQPSNRPIVTEEPAPSISTQPPSVSSSGTSTTDPPLSTAQIQPTDSNSSPINRDPPPSTTHSQSREDSSSKDPSHFTTQIQNNVRNKTGNSTTKTKKNDHKKAAHKTPKTKLPQSSTGSVLDETPSMMASWFKRKMSPGKEGDTTSTTKHHKSDADTA